MRSMLSRNSKNKIFHKEQVMPATLKYCYKKGEVTKNKWMYYHTGRSCDHKPGSTSTSEEIDAQMERLNLIEQKIRDGKIQSKVSAIILKRPDEKKTVTI